MTTIALPPTDAERIESVIARTLAALAEIETVAWEPTTPTTLAHEQGRSIAAPSRDSWARRERRALDLARRYLDDRSGGAQRAADVLAGYCEVRHG